MLTAIDQLSFECTLCNQLPNAAEVAWLQKARGVVNDTDLTAEDLQALVKEYKAIYQE